MKAIETAAETPKKPPPKLKILKPHSFLASKKHFLLPFSLAGFTALVIFTGLKLMSRASETPESYLFNIKSFTGNAKYYDAPQGLWLKIGKAVKPLPPFQIRTQAGEEINLKNDSEFSLRLKSGSAAEISNRGVLLHHGTLLGDIHPSDKKSIQITSPIFKTEISDATFLLHSDSENALSWGGLLRGSIDLSVPGHGKLRLSPHEKIIFQNHQAPEISKMTKQEWRLMKEAYELIESPTVTPDPSLGNLFEHVSDHGVFFSTYTSFSSYNKTQDPEPALKIHYDVLIPGSSSGFYLKLENFDLSSYQGLKFETRLSPNDPGPQAIRMEFKSRGKPLRIFAPRHFSKEWKENFLEFHSRQLAPIDEIVILFSHQSVGEAKQGSLQLRKFTLIPQVPPGKAVPKKSPDLEELIHTLKNLDSISEEAVQEDAEETGYKFMESE